MSTPEPKKSTRWSITVYEGQYPALEAITKEVQESTHPLIAEIGWQDEICPETQRKHRQGYVRTVRQVMRPQLNKLFGPVHLEIAKNWIALKDKYCRKEESRDPSGQQVYVQAFERPLRLHEMLIEVAKTYLRMDRPSEEILSNIDIQIDRCARLRLLRTHSYQLLWKHPEYAVVLSRQDARDTWCDYLQLWIEKAQYETGEGQ